MPRRRVSLQLLRVAAMIAPLLVASCSSGPAGRPGASARTTTSATARARRPNVLFVLTDDMRLDDLSHMPQVSQLVGTAGTTFDEYVDNVTLCCPARASILTGRYSHNTGIETNGGTNGGFETAHANGTEASTLATALHAAGYSTGLFGKYLNGYPNTVDPSYVPPGWDTWSSSTRGNAYGEFDYTLNQDGTQIAYGHTPADYGTDVYARQATSFIDRAHAAGTPFFAYLAVYAPHQPATPAPQDVGAFPGLGAPGGPAYDETDVSDKPAYVRNRPLMDPVTERRVDRLARRRAQSLQAVDRDVAALIHHLGEIGELRDTYVVFTSDNGFHLGEHRLPAGKQTPYETDVHLPLLVRGPGVPAGRHVDALAGNTDVAPTLAALAGATLTDHPDGRSLVPYLQGRSASTADRRQAYLLEHWLTSTAPRDRSGAGQLEPDDIDQGGTADTGGGAGTTTSLRLGAAAGTDIPEYQGLRTRRFTYVEYATGERELYDLRNDPNELVNLASTASSARLAAFHQRLERLRGCAAASCRSAEDAAFHIPA